MIDRRRRSIDPAPATLSVGVNLTWLAPERVGGSEEYLVRQLTAIAQGGGGSDVPLRLRMFCQQAFIDAHPQLTSTIETLAMPVGRDWRGARIVAEHSWLPSVGRSMDVIHHGGGTLPFIGKKRTVLTVHDLQYIRFPEYFSPLRRRYLNVMMPRSVRAATVIAVPSEYVKRRIVDEFAVSPDKIVVVSHGIPPVAIPPHDRIADACARYGIERPYIAYAAITHPHKGHRRLVEMLATTNTPGHGLRSHRLVLIGGQGAAEAELGAEIAASGVADRIVRTGRVPAADRDALIAGADVLAFPSEYEGFGAPLIEAMALDVPVVASDHEAIVEVVGDGGVIVGDGDPRGWAGALEAVIAERPRWVAAGRLRRNRFTLERTGAELGAAYRLAAGLGDGEAVGSRTDVGEGAR